MKKLSLILALMLVLTCGVFAACTDDTDSSSDASTASKVEDNSSKAESSDDSSEAESSDDSSESSDDSSEPETPAVTVDGEEIAVSSYTISQLYQQGGAEVDWAWSDTAPIAYPDEDGKSLTDDVLATGGYDDAGWAGFHYQCPDYIQNGYAWIKLDLGSAQSVGGVKTYVATSTIGSGIFLPTNIEVLVSEDGETFTSVGSVVPVDDATKNDTVVELGFDAVTAQYIEIRISANGFAFVSEVEVFGAADAETSDAASSGAAE